MKAALSVPMSKLETERLWLRPMVEDDADIVVRWRNSEHVDSVGLNKSDGTLTVEEHLLWFHKTRGERVDYVIGIRDSNKLIGSVSCVWRELPNVKICGEIGKYIGETSALGFGYASEAAFRWVEYAFEELRLDCLIARTRSDNVANIKINKKLGFEVEPFPANLGSDSGEWLFMRLDKDKWDQNLQS